MLFSFFSNATLIVRHFSESIPSYFTSLLTQFFQKPFGNNPLVAFAFCNSKKLKTTPFPEKSKAFFIVLQFLISVYFYRHSHFILILFYTFLGAFKIRWIISSVRRWKETKLSNWLGPKYTLSSKHRLGNIFQIKRYRPFFAESKSADIFLMWKTKEYMLPSWLIV